MGPEGLQGRDVGSTVAPPQTHCAWDTWTLATAAEGMRVQGPRLSALFGGFRAEPTWGTRRGSRTALLSATGKASQLCSPCVRRAASRTSLDTGTRDKLSAVGRGASAGAGTGGLSMRGARRARPVRREVRGRRRGCARTGIPGEPAAFAAPRGLGTALSTSVRLPGVTLVPAKPSYSFSKAPAAVGKSQRSGPSRRGCTSLPRQEGRRRRSCACAVRGRPLEWSGVAGFTAPPGVRLRGRRAPSASASPPPVPRGGSGSGGTMFTSTGSSGLCEYRPPPSWLAPPRHLGQLLEEAGGCGDSRGCRRFGGRSSIPLPEPW